jgi:hypothetical protein
VDFLHKRGSPPSSRGCSSWAGDGHDQTRADFGLAQRLHDQHCRVRQVRR